MHVTIDGCQYQAKPGQTVLEVALANGLRIPTLCHDPHLSITGACRMCLVELVDSERLVTSCTTQVNDGMAVITDSPKVRDSRKMVLDLLLSDHPLTCMTCESNGKCKLQDLAYEYGLE